MPFAYNATCAHIRLRVGIPTVTMPRLRSLTTGTLSNFIDIVTNLGYHEQLEDSLLHALHSRGSIIAFAGDHTWANLFPKQFKRMTPTIDSFFVNDFYEGDKNVTKTLASELKRTDWQLLILHYLGLDHIGHVEGTTSLKIPAKLKEMDDVISKIYNATLFSEKLVLLTGDHGMRTGGGHGGSTPEEIYVPLFLYKQNCNKNKNLNINEYNQIDVTPTLSILMNIHIPHSSIGCLIPEMLEDLSEEELLSAYYYNAEHLLHKADLKFGLENIKKANYMKWYKNAKTSHKQFLNDKRSHFSFENARFNYVKMSQAVSTKLSESLVDFDYYMIAIGIALTSTVTIYTLLSVLFTVQQDYFAEKMHVAVALCFGIGINVGCHLLHKIIVRHFIFTIILTLAISASIYLAVKTSIKILQLLLPTRAVGAHALLAIPLPLLCCFIFHTFSLTSSSFIEEEHQTWYYLGRTILAFIAFTTFYNNVCDAIAKSDTKQLYDVVQKQFWEMRASWLMLLLLALLQRLNQTGDKWRHLQDIGDVLNKIENKLWLSGLFAMSLVMLLAQIRLFNKRSSQVLACAISLLLIYTFRASNGTLNFSPLAHINDTILLVALGACMTAIFAISYRSVICKKQLYGYDSKLNIVQLLQTNLSNSLLLAALLQKPHNVILLPVMLFTMKQAYNLCDQLFAITNNKRSQAATLLVYKTVLTIFVGKMFYFFQGNSNSLATIDLNPGFIGQLNYNPLLVVGFVTLNTFCAPIVAFQFLLLHMFAKNSNLLPLRQEKEQHSNAMLVKHTSNDLQLTISLYTVLTLLPVAVYLCLMVAFRFHLFIYTVFAPKMLYECYSVVVFALTFALTNLFLNMFKDK